MKSIDGLFEVEYQETEYGVEYQSGDGNAYVLTLDDEEEARLHQAMFGGELRVREVYATAWAAVSG